MGRAIFAWPGAVRDESKTSALWVIAAMLLGAVLGALVVGSTSAALAGVGAMCLIVGTIRSTTLPLALLILSGFTAFPSAVPTAVAAGPVVVDLYEILLVLVLLLTWSEVPPKVRAVTYWMAAGLVIFSLYGWVRESTADGLIQDTRRLVVMLAAVPVGWVVIGTTYRKFALRTLAISLWASAMFSMFASVGVLSLTGRTQSANFELSGPAGEAAVRLLSPATYAAAAVVCAAAALLILRGGHVVRPWVTPLIAPASLVFILGFARNAVVAVFVAVLLATVAARGSSRVVRFQRLIGALATLVVLLYVARIVLSGTPAGTWLTLQWESFSQRVLFGLTPEGLSQDTSTSYRFDQENPYLFEAVAESPAIGHGFGYPYRPLSTGRLVIEGTEGLRLYAHNFYLWLWVKTGLVGLSVFTLPLLVLIKRGMRTTESVPLAATLGGLMVASLVAPMPLGSPTSMLMGLVVGGLWATTASSDAVPWRSRRRRH